MARKRMFDKRIIETDKFIELPMSTKALYFLLGMYADDRGFISPRYVMRMHGASDDDLKLLITKGYLIYFSTGVVVITDWNKNNWLDSRRIVETEFINEFNALTMHEDSYILESDKALINQGLANAPQTLRENRIEQNSIDNNKASVQAEDQEKDVTKNSDDDIDFKNEFEKLWDIYPNKKGKSVAYKKFVKARKNKTSFDVIENGLKAYVEYCRKNKKKQEYIKYGSTWFTQESWNDEYGVNNNHIPDWCDKEIESEPISDEERLEYEKLLEDLYIKKGGKND